MLGWWAPAELLPVPHQEDLARRADGSCFSRETSYMAAGNTRHKLQPGTPQGQEGMSGKARVGTSSHSLVPMVTSQCSVSNFPRTLAISHSQGFPSQVSPRLPCSPGGHTRHSRRKNNPGERGRFFTSEEVKPGCGSLRALPGSLLQTENQQTGSW